MAAARDEADLPLATQEARGLGRRLIAVSQPAADCTFLAAVTVISVLPYIGRLGFYYDDYSVLERMVRAHSSTLLGLYHAARPLTGQRPLQALTYATLFRLFGLSALGYHIVNA